MVKICAYGWGVGCVPLHIENGENVDNGWCLWIGCGALVPLCSEIWKTVRTFVWSVGWVPLGNIKGKNSGNGEHNLGFYLGSGLCYP